MNDTTRLVIQLLGPMYLAIGVGFLCNKDYYEEMYNKIQGEPFMLLMTGIASMSIGLAIVCNHNLWGNFSEVLVSVIGWGALIKGFWISVCPKCVVKLSSKLVKKGMITFSGSVATIIGLGLCYLSYFVT